VDPAILEATGVVVRKARPLDAVTTVQAGQQPQLDEKLESVAHAEEKLALGHKPKEIVKQRMGIPSADLPVSETNGPRLGRPEVIPVKKPTGKVQKVVVSESHPSRKDFGGVHHRGFRASQPAGVGSLELTVRSVSSEN
jgi:hypothetical protein